MKLLTNRALLWYGLSLVGHVSKAAIGSFYMALPAFKGTMHTISPGRNRVNFQILAYLLTIDLLYGTGCYD